jgi:acyl-CoA synthetase (AMP-forming)/AMP-acid ligase II
MVCRTGRGQDANTVASMTNHLFQRIGQAAEGHESHKLLETPAGSSLNHAEMLVLSGRYAAALLELGAKPGERIAAQIEKSPDALMLYLGAIRAKLAKFKLPKRVIFVEEPPRNALGKVQNIFCPKGLEICLCAPRAAVFEPKFPVFDGPLCNRLCRKAVKR